MSDEPTEVEKLRALAREQDQLMGQMLDALDEKDQRIEELEAGVAYSAGVWKKTQEALRESAGTLQEILIDEDRRAAEEAARPPSSEDVIKRYYRRHARNPKITLKQVCEEMGARYDSIRAAKYHYDRRRKRRHSE